MNKSKLNKKVMLFSIILVFVMCLGCESASENIDDNSTDEVLTTPTEDVRTDNQVLTAEDTNSNLGSDNANDILTDSVGTFTELNATIYDSTNKGVVKLTKNYAFTPGTDDAFQTGIVLNSSVISINGLGYTISGSNNANIFRVDAPNIILKDIIFTNSNGTSFAASGSYSACRGPLRYQRCFLFCPFGSF